MKHIFYADDEPFNLEIVIAYLETDYRIDTAENGVDCMNWLQSNTPDLILLDHQMPPPDGLQICQNIKQDNRLKNIPTIIVSGNTDNESQQNARQLGADDYLIKPFYEEQLLEMIDKYLSQR